MVELCARGGACHREQPYQAPCAAAYALVQCVIAITPQGVGTHADDGTPDVGCKCGEDVGFTLCITPCLCSCICAIEVGLEADPDTLLQVPSAVVGRDD